MAIQIYSDIPFYTINKESLSAISQVTRKAQQFERDYTNKFEDLKAEMKVKEMQLAQLQSEFEALKNINSNTMYERYIQVSEKVRIRSITYR